MAITQAMSTLFKKDLLLGDHHLDTDDIYIALYTSSASLAATTDGYTTSNEVSGTGYTAGGNALSSKAVTENSTSGIFDAADPEWTDATFTARGAFIYNDSHSSKAMIAYYDFGADKSASAGNPHDTLYNVDSVASN